MGELGSILEFGAYGFAGGLLAAVVRDGRWQLPWLYLERGPDGRPRRYLDPGCLVSGALGGLVAAWVDGRPPTALFAGVAAVYLGREVLRPVVRALAERAGLSLEDPGVGAGAAPPVADGTGDHQEAGA